MKNSLLSIIKSQFKLDLQGDHGVTHWKQVERIGIHLSKHYKEADTEVIHLFAFLHDSRREDEFIDPDHGKRAAKFAKELYDKNIIKISHKQLKKLVYACRNHSNKNAKSDDITIKICWDSDRLDLLRLGIQPDASYLYTNLGKKIAIEQHGII